MAELRAHIKELMSVIVELRNQFLPGLSVALPASRRRCWTPGSEMVAVVHDAQWGG
jgi:hypothetical protein